MQVLSLVGYTESKNPIYLYNTTEPKALSKQIFSFSPEDKFDALAVFSYLQLVYWRRYGEESVDYMNATALIRVYEDTTDPAFRAERAAKLGINTAFSMSKYERQLCLTHLQDLLNA